jgi:hypothetical protein
MACNKCNNSSPCNHGCGCNNNCNNCNDCGNTHIQTHICDPCCEPAPCDCPVKDLSTDCVLYNQDDIICDNVVVVPKNTVLSVALQKIVAWVCTRLSEIENFFVIKNVGNGAGVYKGTSLIGEKELKSLTSTNSSVIITPGTNTIDFSVNIPEPQEICITSADDSVTIVQEFDTGCFDLSVPKVCIVSTKGTINVITDEDGCFNLDVNFPQPCVRGGENIIVEEVDNCLVVSTTLDGSQTILQDGTTTSVTGNGTTTTPYEVEIENLQKVISTFPYTVVSTDDKQTIFVDNGVNDVVINIPNGIVSNFTCVFIQKGTGEVTIQQSGTTTLLKPVDLQNKIKAQNNWAMVEKELNTDNYYLIGRLKPL